MNKKIKVILYIIVLLILAFSVYMCLKLNNIYEEGFVSGHCPTTIIKRNNQILLYDPKMVKIPGVNPIVLDSLKDYEKFIKWQRASKIRCPLLHLEQVYDTQNNAQYEIRNSFMSNEPMSPLNHDLPNLNNKSNCMKTMYDANLDDNYFNKNMYPSFDPYNQNIGDITKNTITEKDIVQ